MGSSAKILIRLAPDLHEHLKDKAAEQGLSLNQLVVTLLSGASHFEELRTGGS
jgi:predicted HicB family RNase H-like nuclease